MLQPVKTTWPKTWWISKCKEVQFCRPQMWYSCYPNLRLSSHHQLHAVSTIFCAWRHSEKGLLTITRLAGQPENTREIARVRHALRCQLFATGILTCWHVFGIFDELLWLRYFCFISISVHCALVTPKGVRAEQLSLLVCSVKWPVVDFHSATEVS